MYFAYIDSYTRIHIYVRNTIPSYLILQCSAYGMWNDNVICDIYERQIIGHVGM